jgi:hypothetical protein
MIHLLNLIISLFKSINYKINQEEYYLKYKTKICRKVSWKTNNGINQGWYVDSDKIFFYKYNIIYSEDLGKFLELNNKITLSFDNYNNINLGDLF